jgi:serine/threonine protein kinase
MAATGSSFCHRCGAGIGAGASFCPRCGTSIPVALGDAGGNVATASGRPHDSEWDALLDALRQATLGEYEILAELGRGGMGTVYLAHDLALDRKVAIKVLAPALLLMGEGMVERFKREARTAAALNHPHIIPIYAVKESERVLYFIMQYVPGRALDSIVREVGPLPIPMVQTILAHAGDALSYAHRHGVIHRDIKSANIMLDEEGWAVVTDFGIAKVALAEGLTMTGVTVGTPTYMSPEQCETRALTGASDQYSLGVVAYELLAGRPPFHGESIMSVMYANVNERPRPVTDLRSDCPPGLGAAVMRMLEKDPARRWPSMDDVVAVCGRPSLRHDDPVRSEMITLAKSGDRSRRLAQIKTPTSPIAPAKPPTRASTAPLPRAGLGAPLWWGFAAVGIGVALWLSATWWASQRATLRAPARGPDTVAAAAGAARFRTETVVVSPPRGSAVPPAQPQRPAAIRTPAPRESLSVQREDSLVRSLRAMALAAMRRALEAGATPADMAKGDTVFKGAESLAAQGRLSEAVVQLATAGSLWAEAERASGSRAVRDTVPRPAETPVQPPVVHAPADPRPDIEKVIADYGRALESLDVREVRRAYPGLTAAQQQGWSEFFESVRKLKASLTVTTLKVDGVTAEATVSGLYEYENATTGRAERRPVTFRAVLVADSTGWRLTSIR